ncbi:hypothetical protein [Kribbella sp. CA-294648]|uniref:hypothetical protein n=1 Tax=Kribbella sp. CA-294648 TaxID=3239948 RepID=UPI003D8C0D9A
MQPTSVSPGEIVALDFRHGIEVRVTDHMYRALRLLRPVLIDVARGSGTMTYGEASTACDDAYLPRGMGRLLDVLSVDCERRGEPSLAALVVSKAHGEVGDSFVGDAETARNECYTYWNGSDRSRTAAVE